jgi:hypothetical protein
MPWRPCRLLRSGRGRQGAHSKRDRPAGTRAGRRTQPRPRRRRRRGLTDPIGRFGRQCSRNARFQDLGKTVQHGSPDPPALPHGAQATTAARLNGPELRPKLRPSMIRKPRIHRAKPRRIRSWTASGCASSSKRLCTRSALSVVWGCSLRSELPSLSRPQQRSSSRTRIRCWLVRRGGLACIGTHRAASLKRPFPRTIPRVLRWQPSL